jgi:hypothetical protein
VKAFLNVLAGVLFGLWLFTIGMLVGQVRSDRLRTPPEIIHVPTIVHVPTFNACDYDEVDYVEALDRGKRDGYLQGWDDGHRTCREDRERAR